MKIFSKALCVAALAVAAAPFAKADTSNQINFFGSDTYCVSNCAAGAVYGDVTFGTSFVPSATGVFDAFAGGNVTFNDFNFTSSTTPFDLFQVINKAATEELVYTVTSLSYALAADASSLSITGGGFYTLYTLAGGTPSVISDGTMNFTTQGGGDSFSTTFSDSNTITPEPSSLMLLGTGLVTAAGMLTRRRRVVA